MSPNYQDCKIKQWQSSPTFHLIVVAAEIKDSFSVLFTSFELISKQKGLSLVFRTLCCNKNIYQLYYMRLSCLAVKNARGEQIGTGEASNSHWLELKGILKSSSVSRRLTPPMDCFSYHWIQTRIIGARCSSKITDWMPSGLKHFQDQSPSDPYFYHVLHYIADLSESLQAKVFLDET